MHGTSTPLGDKAEAKAVKLYLKIMRIILTLTLPSQ